MYSAVTPHVEPTHTQYDESYNRVPPRYGTWRGKDARDAHSDTSTEALATAYVETAQNLASLSQANAEGLNRQLQGLRAAITKGDQARFKEIVDEMWLNLRDILQQTSSVELAWNALAPRSMPST